MEPSSAADLSHAMPRVLIVSRRTVRKNKFVDFVGEYHLDLIVGYGAAPVIVPRVAGVHHLLDAFEPIHGVLLCEGEDIDPSHYSSSLDAAAALSADDLAEIRRLHSSDTAVDPEKDSIELRLARRCLAAGIPFLGICRGSQVLNVASGGTLFFDVERELAGAAVRHINYDDYDGHRHAVRVVAGTPLHRWFAGADELMVNSYHHQGVKRLAGRFAPMAFAADGLVEGFYDPELYDPDAGKFLMGLQFHPERMRRGNAGDEFDYNGCPKAYQEFVRAVIAYKAKSGGGGDGLDTELEKKRKIIHRSFSIAKDIYVSGDRAAASRQRDLEPGAEFLEMSTAPALSTQQEKRLKQMGATVRNASAYVLRMKMDEEREAAARAVMGKMSPEQLSELLAFYIQMGNICSDLLEKKKTIKNSHGSC